LGSYSWAGLGPTKRPGPTLFGTEKEAYSGHNCNLDIILKPKNNIDDLKIEEYPSSRPSLPQG